MKVFVLEAKSIVRYLFLSIAIVMLISLLSITGMRALGVYNSGRQIPIYSVECSGKKASITFDCAWGSSDIPAILDTLKKENVRATFFIVGQWAEKYPEMLKLISAAGHDIANHSYSHLRMGVLDRDKIRSEISRCGIALEKISGRRVELFRPPYGDYSNSVISVARELGYYTIQWNVDSLDWKPGIGSQEILGRVMRKVKPGSIILFHNDTANTAKILPLILSSLKDNGYQLIPVSEIIMRENYIIDFEGRQKKRD